MPKYETDRKDTAMLADVIRLAVKYHEGAVTEKTCYYVGVSPGDMEFLKLLEEQGAYIVPNDNTVERFCDEEIQELVKLAQEEDNMYAKMRIAKLLEPVICKCYRNPDEQCYTFDDFFMAAVVRLYEYIDSYRKKGADFCYLLRKRLVGLNGELRDAGNPFYHGMGQHIGRIRRFIAEFESRYDVTPTEQMIAEETGISEKSVKSCLWLMRANETVSLDSPIMKEGEGKLLNDGFSSVKEMILDPSTEMDYVESHRREYIIDEIKKLPALEQAVVFRKFGFFEEPLSRERVCEELKINRSTYERVLANAYDILYLTLKEYKYVV